MLDIKFVRMNPDVVKENIKKKFQDEKLPLVDEVLELDKRNRDIKQEVEALRADRNKISKEIGACMAQGKKDEAEGCGKWLLLSDGRYCKASFCCAVLCTRLYDWPRIYLLYSAIHDPQQCSYRCYEFCRNGCHDV